MSSLVYCNGSRVSCWLEFRCTDEGALPGSIGLDHEPVFSQSVVLFSGFLPFIGLQERLTVLNTRRQVVHTRIRLSRRQVHIEGAGRRVVGVQRMMRGYLAGVRAHAARRLARLDVAPDHGGHVALVVHEAGVEVGGLVGVGRLDVRRASGEGVFLYARCIRAGSRREKKQGSTYQEVEHGEELARGHEHVVAKPAGFQVSLHVSSPSYQGQHTQQ